MAQAVQDWIKAVGAKTFDIAAPWTNGDVERVNARPRNKRPNGEILHALHEAKIVIERWNRHHQHPAAACLTRLSTTRPRAPHPSPRHLAGRTTPTRPASQARGGATTITEQTLKPVPSIKGSHTTRRFCGVARWWSGMMGRWRDLRARVAVRVSLRPTPRPLSSSASASMSCSPGAAGDRARGPTGPSSRAAGMGRAC
jgi:hypothetical protein